MDVPKTSLLSGTLWLSAIRNVEALVRPRSKKPNVPDMIHVRVSAPNLSIPIIFRYAGTVIKAIKAGIIDPAKL